MPFRKILPILLITIFSACLGIAQEDLPLRLQNTTNPSQTDPVFHFDSNDFFERLNDMNKKTPLSGKKPYSPTLNGKVLSVGPSHENKVLKLDTKGAFDVNKDFTIQFWVKSKISSDQATILLSNKKFPDRSLISQKRQGWAFFLSHGTWAWNIGSGKRRLTYERDNGDKMPVNDGQWHQLTMTYKKSDSEIRLYYDGQNAAIYNMGDAGRDGFDFSSNSPLVIGSPLKITPAPKILPLINQGKKDINQLVQAYNQIGIGVLEPNDLEDLIVDPEQLIQQKLKNKHSEKFELLENKIKAILSLRSALQKNPYTVYQVKDFMRVAPLLKIYSWNGSTIVINKKIAIKYTHEECLESTDFDLDQLSIWNRPLSATEIKKSSTKLRPLKSPTLTKKDSTLTVAVWNIHHGGKHQSEVTDGWDSRKRIVEMLKWGEVDVVMMQETYSSGDFIAAELGYYFATASDWDYLNQGTNISVLSRFPIKKIYVPKGASFMNVGAKIAVSDTQDIYVMSNWYGMNKFSNVFDFHKTRFAESKKTPTFFGGDFNVVSHLDGGSSPASKILLDSGFTLLQRRQYHS